MYIGKLNHLARFSLSDVTLSVLKTVPHITQTGNPLLGESFFIPWKEKISSGVDIRIPLEKRVFVDRVKLTFPQGLNLSAVSLYSGEKAQLLQRYSAETGGVITKEEIALDANYETDLLTLVFEGDFSGVGLDNLEIFGSYGEAVLYPTPVDARITRTRVPVADFRGCWGDCPEGIRGAEVLQRKFAAAGVELPLAEIGAFRFVKKAGVAENGFELIVEETSATVYASDLRGFVYGAETAVKLLENGTLPLCRISDRPRMPFRGVHLFLPARENIPFFQRFVEHILSPMGYNCIFLQISGGMEFKTHPEINEAYIHAVEQAKAGLWPNFPHSSLAGGKVLSQQEVAGLAEFARSFGIEVIPEVQSLGHVQHMTLAHPEIAEIEEIQAETAGVDTRKEDERPKKFYPHCYCPSNPKSYEILFDILDEIIDVIKPPKYVHMGHDEVYEIGVCPVCRKEDPARLFAQDVNRIHAHLKEKGLTMMMWADMIQPVTKYKTHAAIDWIPKDILLLDFVWYFHMDKDIEDNLLEKGFRVLFGNMNSSHYPRYESRVRKPGILGAETSAWVGTSVEELSREGKLYEWLFAAQMMWSETYSENHKFTYDRILKQRIPAIRGALLDCRYPSMDPGAKTTVLVRLPAQPEIRADCRCRSLVLHHTVEQKLHREPWKPLQEIGRYLVEYADGAVIPVPVLYGGNICYYGRRQNEPFPHGYYRHNGYTAAFMVDSDERREADGSYYCVYRCEWLNPRPEAALKRVILTQPEGFPAKIRIHEIDAVTV